MSKCKTPFGSKYIYWETEQYNNSLYFMFRDNIMSLAINRYKWIGLPDTCNTRWLEWLLLNRGCATIAAPKRIKALENSLYTLECVQQGEPDAYYNPKRWLARGANGRLQFMNNKKSGVWVWDNMTRYPIMQKIEIWARELVDVTRTKQMNRFHQKIPFILSGTNKQKTQMLNTLKQIAGYELAFMTNEAFDGIEAKVLTTGVPYLGEQLTIEERNIWSEVYSMLGIRNLTYKTERMVQDEIDTQQAPTDLMALDGLQPRREAAEQLNKLFGLNVSVVFNQDNYSQNYNFSNNIQEQIKGGVCINGTGDIL